MTTTRRRRFPLLVKIAAILALVLGVIAAPWITAAAANATPGHGGGHTPVTICHKPGTPAEHEITVDDDAVPAHLEHGDTLGACPVTPPPVEEPDPTPEPTPDPEPEPTDPPVEEPTDPPTDEPTDPPLETPDPEPTPDPTPDPTDEPTTPTDPPTEEPTSPPTTPTPTTPVIVPPAPVATPPVTSGPSPSLPTTTPSSEASVPSPSPTTSARVSAPQTFASPQSQRSTPVVTSSRHELAETGPDAALAWVSLAAAMVFLGTLTVLTVQEIQRRRTR